jgi:ABC-type multidrug transport system fused ATPase/permease subunit
MPPRSVVRYYVEKLRRVLLGVPRLVGFLLASVVHAVGHALLALVAGAVALSLSERFVAPPPAIRSPASAGTGALGGALSAYLPGVLSGDSALFLSLLGLGVVIVKGAAGAYATYVQARVAGQVGSDLRLELLDALLAVHRLHRPRHDDQGGDVGGTARGVAALTEHVREVEAGLEQGLLGGARAAAQIVPIGALLVALSGRMALVAALVLGAFGAALAGIRGGYRRASRRAAVARDQLLEAADEAVRHADLWVTYGAEWRARGLVRRLGEAIAAGAARLQVRAAISSSVNEVLGALALVAAIGASGAGWLGQAPDGRTLFLFAIAFFLAYRPLRELADARLALVRAQGAYEDVAGFIRGVGERTPRPAATSRSDWPVGVVELRSLRLAHGAREPLSLRIEAGAIAVLAGPTGIGKTTLLRTLLGLERPASGEVFFDGQPIGDAPAGPAGRPFAWVPQDAPVVADTLEANVSLAAEAHPREALEALEAVSAAHLARALGGERLGAGGRAVSGGERQWIALARAIATRQPVLLLDEPTSGLDGESQERVLDAIARLRGKRTVLLVTHRPEPLAIADVVVRLDARGAIERAA